MRKIILIVCLFLFYTTAKVFSQINYEKRIGDKSVVVQIKTDSGPAVISIIDHARETIDTLIYAKFVVGAGYYIYDSYLDDNLMFFAFSLPSRACELAIYSKEGGDWKGVSFYPKLLLLEELTQPHEIKIIDRNHIKVTKGGKYYIHTIDYKERKDTITEENK